MVLTREVIYVQCCFRKRKSERIILGDLELNKEMVKAGS